MKKNTVISNLLLSAILYLMVPGAAFAKDCPSDIKAVTDEDPAVPVEVLEHQVKPLTKCELEAEAAAWVAGKGTGMFTMFDVLGLGDL